MADQNDEYISRTTARRSLTVEEKSALAGARDFIQRRSFAARRETPLGRQWLVGIATAAVGVGIIAAAGRMHGRPTPAVSTIPPSATADSTPSAPLRYVAWAPLPDGGIYPTAPPGPAPTPRIPVPPGTPACRASQLEGEGYLGQGFTGEVSTRQLVLRNRGGSPCVLEGLPGLSVMDASGRVLAQGFGSEKSSAYLPSEPAAMVLMEPGTPTLPRSGGFGPRDVNGQAGVPVLWIDCRRPQAAQLAVALPAAGGRLVIPFPVSASWSAACPASNANVLDSGPFIGSGGGPLPSPAYIPVAITLDAPASVRRGSTLVYYITLTNTGLVDYRLDPCPDYHEFVGRKEVFASYQLNCAPVERIGPGTSVRFQMQLAIPASIQAGATDLTWTLGDGRLAPSINSTPLTITP